MVSFDEQLLILMQTHLVFFLFKLAFSLSHLTNLCLYHDVKPSVGYLYLSVSSSSISGPVEVLYSKEVS